MNKMTTAWALLVAAFCATPDCDAQAAGASMRPSLVALQVVDLDATVRWYTTFLGFREKDRREFPADHLKLAILTLRDFDLELVENPKTLERAKLLSHGATDITGFAKVTFRVDDVGGLFRRLREQGATFAAELRASNTNPADQFFIVLDNERNWLQFIGRK